MAMMMVVMVVVMIVVVIVVMAVMVVVMVVIPMIVVVMVVLTPPPVTGRIVRLVIAPWLGFCGCYLRAESANPKEAASVMRTSLKGQPSAPTMWALSHSVTSETG